MVAFIDVIYSLLLNLFPLILFAIPIPFLRKKTFGMIYTRLYYGLCLFFLVYWVLPSMLQFSISEVDTGSEDTILGIKFLLNRSFSMLLLYAQYPFYVLPFIFVISPFFAFVLLYRRLKTEAGDNMAEKFKELSYSYDQSPRDLIMKALKDDDWTKEKEIFKAFAILLPISLYLLTVILDIAKLDPVNVSESSTALGWFIEILFVYIATFLFGFQLVSASKVSYKGRFIGEQIQSKFFTSLTEVGTPISILSILLFVAQKTQSLLLIVFFFAYFLMAAFIFIVLLRIFEPISILILVKIINWWKLHTEEKSKPNYQNAGMIAVYAMVAAFLTLVIIVIFSQIIVSIFNRVPDGENFLELSLAGGQPSFDIIVLTDTLSTLSSLQSILITLILAYTFSKAMQLTTSNGIAILIFGGVLLLTTIAVSPIFLFNGPLILQGDKAWTTGAPIELDFFGFQFFTMRTAFLTSDLSNNVVLLILAIPFLFLRPFVNFILMGFLMSFIDKRFRSKTIPVEGKMVDRTTFSDIYETPTAEEFKNHPEFLITAENVVFTKDEGKAVMDLFQMLKDEGGITVKELQNKYGEEIDRLYAMLKFLSGKNYITWWTPEFGYRYETATLDGLYVLYSDGRDLLYYNFQKDQESGVDPALVSGMFSALTSFIQETTKSTEHIAAIDAGDKKVILEYSDSFPLFGALFADRETREIRMALKEMLHEFDEKHKKVLGNWNGNMSYFKEDGVLVEKYFNEFLEE